jgi:hypothetical protein
MASVVGSTGDTAAGVLGENTNNTNTAGPGVWGKSAAAGVLGESTTWHGVAGLSKSTTGGVGVFGQGLSGNIGVLGESTEGAGVKATSQSGPGLFAQSNAAGIWGKSETWMGVFGETQSTTGGAGVMGEHKNGGVGVLGVSEKENGIGVLGRGKRLAGLFEGEVSITGNLTLQGVSIQTWLQRIVQLEQQATSAGQLVQRINSLEQKVTALQSQVDTAVSNLTGRITLAEVAISDLKSRVQKLEGK